MMQKAANRSRAVGRVVQSPCVLFRLCGWVALCLASPSSAQILQDYFTNRVTITNVSGQVTGNNTGATIEPGEPLHAGKPGGHSLWMSWVAPSNGVVTFETSGSGFDTLLAAYRFGSTNDTALSQLLPVSWSDDSQGLDFESSISFGAIGGQAYEIAVDGYYGAMGEVELNWSFVPTVKQPPIFVSVTPDFAANLGDTVMLTAVLTNIGAAQFQWLFNGRELPQATDTNLVIASFQSTNVGRYELDVSVSGQDYTLPGTELQINTEGLSNVLARAKLLDTPTSPLKGEINESSAVVSYRGVTTLSGTALGVARGYNGTQIFNTIYSPSNTNDPPHCGFIGGTPYWLLYQPPVDGTLTMDTVGSSYDTVMEFYTFNGTLTGYQDLISLDCNNDAPGLGTASRVQSPVVASRQYVVVVDGVNGASGTAWLNYSLDTNQLPQPPTLLTQPLTNVVVVGANVTLAPDLAGAPPLQFAWSKLGAPLSGQTNAFLFLSNVVVSAEGSYTVAVTNDLGGLTATLPLRVLVPTVSTLSRSATGFEMSFPTATGQIYTVMQAPSLNGPWVPWFGAIPGDGSVFSTNISAADTSFFRVLIQ